MLEEYVKKWIFCFILLVGFQVFLALMKIFIKKSDKTKDKKDFHFLRRIQHIFSGVILVILYKIVEDPSTRIIFNFFGFLILFVMNYGRKRSEIINKVFLSIFSEILRKEELIEKKQISSTYFMLGCTMSLILFDIEIACLAVLILSFGDPIASVVGIKFGKIKIYAEKSVIGNVVCSISCGILTLLYLNYGYKNEFNLTSMNNLSKFLVGGITGCISELMPSKFLFDDNMSIPIYAGTILSLFNKFFA